MAKQEMPRIEMVLGADGSFGAVIGDRMRNGKINRASSTAENISFPKADFETYALAASHLVGLLPRVPT